MNGFFCIFMAVTAGIILLFLLWKLGEIVFERIEEFYRVADIYSRLSILEEKMTKEKKK